MTRRSVRLPLTLAALLTATGVVQAQTAPGPSREDRVRLAEAFRLAEAVRPAVWPGWERTPMPVLLVTDSAEFLVGHSNPSADFTPLGLDSMLGRNVMTRPRRFPPTLLATFPAIGGRSTIVIGTAERTGKSSAEWVLTVLHEHFHQWQASLPGYYAGTAALGLSGGDTTGQWMLDYPFPYDVAPVQRAVRDLATTIHSALGASPAERAAAGRLVQAARERLRRLLPADDYRYLEFQLWQEGVPRFVELAAAEAAAALQPAAGFRALPDYGSYALLAAEKRRELERQLSELDLGGERRVAFYALGAGLGSLLRSSEPGWQDRYASEPFTLAALPSR